MKKHDFKIHTILSIAIFMMGNFVIEQPFYKLNFSLLEFIAVSFFTVIFALLFSSGVYVAFNDKQMLFKKAIYYCIIFLTIAASIYGIFSTSADYLTFVKAIQLPNTKMFLIMVVYIISVLMITRCKTEALLKIGLCMAALVFVFIVLLFAVSFKIYDFSGLKNNSDLNLLKSFNCALKYFSPVLSIILFFYLSKLNVKKSSVICGIVVGLLAVLITFSQVIFVLGANFDYQYAYIYAVSVFSSGNLFYRLDGIVYLIFFVCAVLKTTICIKSLIEIFKKLNMQKQHYKFF